jgi:hypothetical protein
MIHETEAPEFITSPYGRGSAIPAVAALKPTIQPVRIKL